MSYGYSSLDNKNIKWFIHDHTKQSLRRISINEGSMRGINSCDVEFTYPITAIAGSNGSGKSTLLALASCAFHNKNDGFFPPFRKHNYYTYGDFFIQSQGEISPDGVKIAYAISHNKWKGREPAIGTQYRKKPKGGKWNRYDSRVKRNVIYFGVQRVVPYFERQTHKSYRSHFVPGTLDTGVRTRIALLAGNILGKTYADFDILEHSKYSLPKVKAGNIEYSGFNMGAGESAVLDILSTMFAAGNGCLIIIDEIELGLHQSAQLRFIQTLKELCLELKCQIICTTHSYEILASLPPEGRIYIENTYGKTHVYSGISPEYACGKMGKNEQQELDIFVEDEVAFNIVLLSLDKELRSRCRIIEIGSHSSLTRLMAARYMENRRNCLCLFDGDQRNKLKSITESISKMCDGKFANQNEKIIDWANNSINFMPGKEWPEKWLFERAILLCDDLFADWEYSPSKRWGIPDDKQLKNYLEQALNAGLHNEFTMLSNLISLPEDSIRNDLISAVRSSLPEKFDNLNKHIMKLLTGT